MQQTQGAEKDKFTTEGAKQHKAVNQQIKKDMVKARETWIEERCQEIDDSLGKNNSKKAGERSDQFKTRPYHHHTG